MFKINIFLVKISRGNKQHSPPLGRRPNKQYPNEAVFARALYDLADHAFNIRLPECVTEDLYTEEYSQILLLKSGKWIKYKNWKGIFQYVL